MRPHDAAHSAIIEPNDGSHLSTRYRLMDAAARLMAHQGYVGTSVRAIASRAGVTTGAIYAHFPGGKEELFLAILSAVGSEVQRHVGEALIAAADPVDLIVRQAGALWDFFERYPSFAALLVRENVSGALGDPSPFVEQNAEAILQLRAMFTYAMAEGLMAPVNASYVMFWVTTTCMTFHGCGPLRDTVWTPEDIVGARQAFLLELRRMLTPTAPVRSRQADGSVP